MKDKPVTDSLWFMALGDKLLVAAVFACLAPVVYALDLARSGHVQAAVVVGVLWCAAQAAVLWYVHIRRLVRLVVSVPCVLLAVVAVVVGSSR